MHASTTFELRGRVEKRNISIEVALHVVGDPPVEEGSSPFDEGPIVARLIV